MILESVQAFDLIFIFKPIKLRFMVYLRLESNYNVKAIFEQTIRLNNYHKLVKIMFNPCFYFRQKGLGPSVNHFVPFKSTSKGQNSPCCKILIGTGATSS